MSAERARLVTPAAEALGLKDSELLRSRPHNPEAEVQLLGAVLANNRAWEVVSDFLKPEMFGDDRHARIYGACAKLIGRGQVASQVTLKNYFEQDSTLTEIGGVQYLGALARAAVTIINAGEHGRIIEDLYQRRQLIALGEDIVNRAYAHDLESSSTEQIEAAEHGLMELRGAGPSPLITARAVREDLVRALNKPLPCYSTGFPRFDAAMGGGLFAGRTYGLMGRKKQCKTLWGGSISAHLNREGVPHLYVAGEMGPGQIEQRSMAAEIGVNSLAFMDGWSRQSTDFVRLAADAAVKTGTAAVYSDARGLTFDRLRRDFRTAVARHKIRGAIVDYLQLVGGKPVRKSMAEHMDEVCQWLADFAAINGIWLLALGQMNQEGNVRHGEAIRLAFDQVYETKRDQGGEGLGVYLEMMDTRYTRWGSVGSEASPAYLIDDKIGPRLLEQQE